jgi:hypothetical protein
MTKFLYVRRRTRYIGILMLSLLAACSFWIVVITLVFNWIADSYRWDIEQIADVLGTSIPEDASNVVYTGSRDERFILLNLSFDASEISVTTFAEGICNTPLQEGYDPFNSIYLSDGDNGMEVISPLSSQMIAGLRCERNSVCNNPFADGIDTGREVISSTPTQDIGLRCARNATCIIALMTYFEDRTNLQLQYNSPCRPPGIGNFDRRAIPNAPFIFRGSRRSAFYVEIDPKWDEEALQNYVGSRVQFSIDGETVLEAEIGYNHQLEVLGNMEKGIISDTYFDVIIPRRSESNRGVLTITILLPDNSIEQYVLD